MPATFNYFIDYGASEASAPKVSNIQFGDGYVQRVSHGINIDGKVWNLNFRNREIDEIDEIVEFFESKKGVDPFLWTPPGETTALLWVCQQWSRVKEHATTDSLTATFVQVFDPTI